jgi:hypothetical protein
MKVLFNPGVKTRKGNYLTYLVFTVFFFSLNFKVIGQSINSNTSGNSVFSRILTNTEGSKQSIQSFQGKKIWVIILPDSLKNGDSSLFVKIDSVAAAKYSTVQTIIIPVIGNNNFISDGGVFFDPYYKTLRNHHIFFSIPTSTKKKNRVNQTDDMVSWLTNASLNGHFDKEPDESGAMYLIDEKGVLRGMFEMNTILNTQQLNFIFQ